MDAHSFPDLNNPDVPRRIFVSNLSPVDREVLEAKGYECVELLSLRRITDEENCTYIRAKLQAIEEGTIDCCEEGRKRLELEARAYGLLDAKRRAVAVHVTKTEQIDNLLTWDSGRHTLAQNSTAIWAQPPEKKDE